MYNHFIRHYLFRVLLTGWILNLGGTAQAQEFLTGLQFNTQIMKESQQRKENLGISKNQNAPLWLPFFEDFSNYTGYPNEKLFIDRQGYVNNNFPVFPPSIGVVTLDALDEYGKIYSHLNTISKGADTLTSRYIRLDSLYVADTLKRTIPGDSLYFSFYYQPGGVEIDSGRPIGNLPNESDSLVLEFGYIYTGGGDTYTKWEHVWSTPGFKSNTWLKQDSLHFFRQVIIPITDEKYLCNNFQFRFRNYASLEPQQGISGWEGNVDQWHIDYIRLDAFRNYNDIFSNDLAFAAPTTSFLANYQSMPWKQFRLTDIKSNFTNYLTNMSNGARTSNYQYTITSKGNVVSKYAANAINVSPYFTHGFQQYETQASPKIKPSDFSILTDTATFKIVHIFQNTAGGDFCKANDTCIYEQKFYDYYAYDDGSAEYGYCLINPYNEGYLAMKFSLQVPDSLRGVRMWFNRTKNSENENAVFSIIIWKDNNGIPGTELGRINEIKPDFGGEFLDFWEYTFANKVPVSGNIWVGFKQQGNLQLNIGFDQNNDSREFFKFKTRGIWETSAFKGTPMIRPTFGNSLHLSINTPSPAPAIKIAPNPTAGELRIENGEQEIKSIDIYDIYGKMVLSHLQVSSSHPQIDVSHLSSGIYFIRFYKNNNMVETAKFIKY